MSTLVTGTPGSGKTTLVAYAKKLDDKRFVDADEIAGLCEWQDFATGKVIGLVEKTTITSDDDWFKKHGWYWREDRLKEFLQANPEAIICGSAENIAGCYKLFDRIIVMQKTEADLLRNLQSPERLNPFGKTTKQRAGFMEWQDYLLKEAQPYSPIIATGNDITTTYQTITNLLSK
jgi:adenylate kinase family enzyme